MGIRSLLGVSVALVSFASLLHSIPACADGPAAAYDSGATDASLDPGEERMTADEENKARLKDLSDAYHNGYNARAKEDAETYASLRDQLKHAPKQDSAQLMPPLPEGMPGDENTQVTAVQKPQVVQRSLPPPQPPEPPQPQYRQAYQQPQYLQPQPVQYQQAQEYAAPPDYAEVAQEYPQPVYAQEAYAPPPPPPPPPQQAVQYVAVYGQPEYVPQPPVQAIVRPVIAVARPPVYPGYRRVYWARPYRRVYPAHYGYPVQTAGYRDWE